MYRGIWVICARAMHCRSFDLCLEDGLGKGVRDALEFWCDADRGAVERGLDSDWR
jgi:hypothetical protein